MANWHDCYLWTMFWVTLALGSALFLGFYDIAKKKALTGNAVLPVLFFVSLTCAALLSPAYFLGQIPSLSASEHLKLLFKAAIVTSSWVFTFHAVSRLPLSITAPVRASAPIFTIAMAVAFMGERPSSFEWLGIGISLAGYFAMSVASRKETGHFFTNLWILSMFFGTFLGSVSGVYDKFLLQREKLDPLAIQFFYNIYMAMLQGILILVSRLLKKGANENELYALATDFLIALHSLPENEAVPAGLPPYDEHPLRNEVMLFPDWYMPAVFGRETDKKAADEFILLWEELFEATFKVPQTLVLRDYHIDNLMRLDGREGVKACGLLDFQDALNGAITYDIMSLLEDARRDISPELFVEMQARYIDGMGEHLGDREDFLTSWAVLAAQRHTKVLGIFVRLCVRDHKPNYLQHIPRLWRLLENSLNHPALHRLKEWFDANVPAEYRKIPSCAKE